MDICLDTYNVMLQSGTGIATYARTLGSEIRKMGNHLHLLFGMPVPKGLPPSAAEIAVFNYRPNAVRFPQRLLRLASSLTAPQLFWGRIFAQNIGTPKLVDYRSLQDQLPAFDCIHNAPQLYTIARVRNALLGRPTRVKFAGKIDVMHWTFPVAAYAKGTANIYTIHDLVPLKTPFLTCDAKGHFYRMVKQIVERADRIATDSFHAKKDIMDILGVPADKIVVTHLAAQVPEKALSATNDEIANLIKETFGLDFGRYFLFVGAIEPKKNVARLLDAYLGAKVKLPLVLAGPLGWMTKKQLLPLHQAGNSEAARSVRRLGFVTSDQKFALMRGARALIFPSIYEGFGLPPLEAMALGCPVITSNVTSLPEICGNAAYYVNPFQVADIRKAIVAFANDPDLANDFGSRGKQQAQVFSMHRFRNRVQDLYGITPKQPDAYPASVAA
jgi:glycosyltransferase involved in cell wall biosynthesis